MTPETTICVHGHLARQCEVCERDSEIAALIAEEDALQSLLERCVRQVNGNRGAWEDMAEPWSPDAKTARAKAMAECDALLADIDRALGHE